MDANEVSTVWPSADLRALTDAFKSLEHNRVVYDACAIEVSSDAETAAATCHARVEFVPKIGSRSVQVLSQQWRFGMSKVGPEWKISDASALEER